MRLRAAALPGLLLVAACGSSAAPGAKPSPSPSPSPSAATSPTPGALARCHTDDLEATIAQIQGAAGTLYVTFEFRDKAAHDCTMYGYPGTAIIDVHGHQLPTNAVRTPDYPNRPGGPTLVTLTAGSAPLGGDHAGHAISLFSFNQSGCMPSAAESPSQWQVTPPDETTSLFVAANKGDSTAGPVCNGTVQVRPVAPPDYLSF